MGDIIKIFWENTGQTQSSHQISMTSNISIVTLEEWNRQNESILKGGFTRASYGLWSRESSNECLSTERPKIPITVQSLRLDVRILKKWALTPVKGCISSKICELASQNEEKQAEKAKVSFSCIFYIVFM